MILSCIPRLSLRACSCEVFPVRVSAAGSYADAKEKKARNLTKTAKP